MVYMESNATRLTEFGRYITERRLILDLSQNEVARQAGISSGNLSRKLRGDIAITHEDAEALADVLKVDVRALKRLANLPTMTPPAERNETIEYWAQQLDDLEERLAPDEFDALLEAVGAPIHVARELLKRRPRFLDGEHLDLFGTEGRQLETDRALLRLIREELAANPELRAELERVTQGGAQAESGDDQEVPAPGGVGRAAS